MIEELTPQVLAISIVLILLSAPFVTAVISAICLWLYRRAVVRAMSATSQSHPVRKPIADSSASDQAIQNPKVDTRQRTKCAYHSALESPKRDALQHAIAVFIAAVPLSLAAQIVYPSGLGAIGVFIGVWVYSWASVPMLLLVLPYSRLKTLAIVAFYFLVYGLLCVYATSVGNIPALQFGGVDVSERSGATPVRMVLLWLIANGVPTLLCTLCFNRKLRAVAPSVLALVSLMITGLWFSWLWVWSPSGETAMGILSETLNVNLQGTGVMVAVIIFVTLAVASRYIVGAIARAYRHKSISDRFLSLIAIFIVFLTMYTMWLTVGGLHWISMMPISIFIYWLVLRLFYRRASYLEESYALCFLRVFALGGLTQELLDSLAKYWRNIGNIQMITGPDVATSTVQPHQFLDFLSGDLKRHFISNEGDLDSVVAQMNQPRDRDGRFRINNLFCYENTWQMALRPMVSDGARVLMDLRRFSEENSGCREELNFLAAEIPFRQCLIIVDQTTDHIFLKRSVQDALDSLTPNACNTSKSFSELRQVEFAPGDDNVRLLLECLLK